MGGAHVWARVGHGWGYGWGAGGDAGKGEKFFAPTTYDFITFI